MKALTIEELSGALLERFKGTKITFEEIRIETLGWPCAEKHYRESLKRLEAANRVEIQRVKSKKSGVERRDIVVFR